MSVGEGITVGVSVGAATVGVGELLETAAVGATGAGAEVVFGNRVGVTVGILSVITCTDVIAGAAGAGER